MEPFRKHTGIAVPLIRDDINGTKELHVGENGYDEMFDHDTIGIVSTLLTIGDFTYAKDYLTSLPAQLQYDDDGQCLTGSFMDYLVPTASEAPVIDIAHVVSPSPLTPLGSKGLGESSSMTVPAAIANAVSDALGPLGVRITELPMSPTRLWELIERAKQARDVPRP